jgi:hypothetical protein
MTPRSIALLAALALTIIPAVQVEANGELMFGCWTRPACGKVCKLVCETTTLVVECYGAECEQICVPGPSQPGCKHCSACCGECEPGVACPPKCEFCWRDWCPSCAQPRSVKVLKKYQAEKEVCWYHWEVVDGCNCGCGCGKGCEPGGCEPSCGCDCVYKPAPADAQIGDSLELSDEESAQVVAWKATRPEKDAVQQAEALRTTGGDVQPASQVNAAAGDQSTQPLWQKLSGMFRRASDQP